MVQNVSACGEQAASRYAAASAADALVEIEQGLAGIERRIEALASDSSAPATIASGIAAISEACRGIRLSAQSAIDVLGHGRSGAALTPIRIATEAQRDALTGLFNRETFSTELERFLAPDAKPVALFSVDLVGIGGVNVALGHEAGNAVLREAALRLSSHPDIVMSARTEGDEFAVLLQIPDYDDDKAWKLAEQLMSLIMAPFSLDGNEVSMSCRIGVAIGPRDGDTHQMLMRHAKAALHFAKRSDDGIRVFKSAIIQGMSEHVLLAAEARRAIHNSPDEFEIHYQPQFDMALRRIVGAEALLRWRHPERGLVSPGLFVPIAEANNLMIPIGRVILRKALSQAAAWSQIDYFPEMRIGVNISARQFSDPGFAASVREAIEETGIRPDLVELELTESTLMSDAGHNMAALRELKNIGLRLAIDDFGTGYSSLAYLKRFPIDKVKIDRAFVSDLDRDKDSRAIVSAIMSLAGSLGLGAIAEGVETDEQAVVLADSGCREIQGFWMGRPMDSATFDEFVRNYVLTRSATASPFERINNDLEFAFGSRG